MFYETKIYLNRVFYPNATDSCAVVDRSNLQMALGVQFIISVVLYIIILAIFLGLLILIFRCLLKYLKSTDVRHEKAIIRKSLGEVLKENRIRCKMTQEFVSESIGVSRQAVSKWENGASDPSTSNLLALAKLYGISAEDLLKEVE